MADTASVTLPAAKWEVILDLLDAATARQKGESAKSRLTRALYWDTADHIRNIIAKQL